MLKRDQFDDRIRNLIALAQDGSEHSRTLLFSHISDLFLQKRPMASDVQIRMLTEILKELLDQVALPVRQEIASTLYNLTDPPEELIDIMCEDVVEVSGPLLEKANLPDGKLIHIIRYGTETHRRHISNRFGLSPLVRHELEKAFEEAHSSKLKYSLNELDKLAEDTVPDMDEETTANILELLRAQKIHKSYSEQVPDNPPAGAEDTSIAAEKSSPVVSAAFPNNREKNERTSGLSFIKTPPQTEKETKVGHAKVSKDKPARSHDKSYKDKGGLFTTEIAANDAALPVSDINLSDSRIQMGDASLDMDEDISQEVQEACRETRRQHEFARTTADWFWEVDRSGLISFISEEAFIVFGRPTSSLVGEDFISLCTLQIMDNEKGQGINNFETLFEDRSSFRNAPVYIALPDEEKSLWYISAIAIFDIHTGRFAGFRGSARAELSEEQLAITSPPDNSGQKATMDSGIQEEALEDYFTTQAIKAVSQDANSQDIVPQEMPIEEKEELLQNLSHEFRTPLNAIIGFSEMINMEAWGPVNKHYHQNIKNILTAALQLKEAVNDVLDSARLVSGLKQINPESFSLKSVLKNCQENVEAMAAENHVQLMNNDNNIDVILYNDKQSVELCLTKMLSNIIRRAKGGEMISPSVLINSSAQVRIEIPMLGPKIDEKDAIKMFDKLKTEPDEQRHMAPTDIKYEPKISTGYGLSIAQNLAHMIGGEISVHTAQGYITHLVLILSNHDPVA